MSGSGFHDLVKKVWPESGMESDSQNNVYNNQRGPKVEVNATWNNNHNHPIVLVSTMPPYGPYGTPQVRINLRWVPLEILLISNALVFIGGVMMGCNMNGRFRRWIRSLIPRRGNDGSSQESSTDDCSSTETDKEPTAPMLENK